jgi:hypothetical protein
MALTGTVHPPAASTALLAVVDDTALGLGWFLVPLTMISVCIMFVVALLVMNVQRQFPLYWWTPERVGGKGESKIEVEKDLESGSGSEDEKNGKEGVGAEVVITRGKVYVPEHLALTPEDVAFLESLSNRL